MAKRQHPWAEENCIPNADEPDWSTSSELGESGIYGMIAIPDPRVTGLKYLAMPLTQNDGKISMEQRVWLQVSVSAKVYTKESLKCHASIMHMRFDVFHLSCVMKWIRE